MIHWWQNLSLEQQIYFGLGILSLLVTLIQLALTVLGVDADTDVDIGTDAGADHSTGAGLFSVQTIAAFFTGFGWTGGIFAGAGFPMAVNAFAAFSVGGICMTAMYFLLGLLLSLQSQGNLEYASAVGQNATVYLTVPGENQGTGQINVVIQGRLTTADARKESAGEAKTGCTVKIVRIEGPTTFIIDNLSA